MNIYILYSQGSDTTKKEMLGIVVTPHWAVTNVELAMKIILYALSHGKNSSVIHDITHCCTNTKYSPIVTSFLHSQDRAYCRDRSSVDGNGRDSILFYYPFYRNTFKNESNNGTTT
ncbi:hypothetical protein ACJX0J_037102 [Zea mays]